MKGIILAGGNGTRLNPITLSTTKQLLPVYSKPMIYYPLSLLMWAGIREILIITKPEDKVKYQAVFQNGSHLGLNIQYKIQSKPNGISEAFILGKEFIGDDDVCLVLGDNIFYGHGFVDLLKKARTNVEKKKKATVFGYYVNDPQRYGVVDFDKAGNALTIEEKPAKPKSNYAVIGLYFYPNSVVDIAHTITPSDRGELEITAVNQKYLEGNCLKVELMGRGYAWLDTGTHESLLEASNFIQTIEHRQGLKVACIEEIAYEMGYISKEQLLQLAEPLKKNNYGKYLISRAKD